MSTYLVDTDWFIEVLNGNEMIGRELEVRGPAGLAISLITYGELYQGVWYARDPARRLQEFRDT